MQRELPLTSSKGHAWGSAWRCRPLPQEHRQPLAIQRRRTIRIAANASDGAADTFPDHVAYTLGLKLARLRALEDYRSLLASSDVLAPATAAPPQGNATPPVESQQQQQQPQPQPQQHSHRAPVDLLAATILISRHERPHLDAAWCEQEVSQLAADVEARLPPGGPRYPLRVVREINKVLYEDAGFHGASDNYYDPDNSCVDQVLSRRTGIPISLSLVYMAVAFRVGLEMQPVNLPAHLMLRPVVAPHRRAAAAPPAADQANDGSDGESGGASGSGGGGEAAAPAATPLGPEAGSGGDEEGDESDAPGILVDAFHGGELCWLQDAEERLSAITGMQVVLDPRWASGASPAMSGGSFLLRWLNNVRQVHMLSNEPENALAILRYMRATLEAMQQQSEEQQQRQQKQQDARTARSSSAVPAALGPLAEVSRDEGLCLYALGRWAEAAEALSSYLEAAPAARDAALVSTVLEKVRLAQRGAAAAEGAGGGEVSGSGGEDSSGEAEPKDR